MKKDFEYDHVKKIFEDNNIFFYDNIDYKISSGQSWSKQNFPFFGEFFFSRSPFKIKTERVELNDLIMAEVEVETRSSSFDDLSLRGRRPGDSICFRVFLRSNVLAFVSRRQYQLQWLIEGGGEIKIFPFCRNARTVCKSKTRSCLENLLPFSPSCINLFFSSSSSIR